MGRPADAIKLLGPAIASTPDDYVLHDVLATAYAKLQRYDEAIACARRVIELNPQVGRSHRRLADLLGSANRSREAREPALTAVRLEPENSSTLATAARRCDAAGNSPRLPSLQSERFRSIRTVTCCSWEGSF